jgi:hypothetical protein
MNSSTSGDRAVFVNRLAKQLYNTYRALENMLQQNPTQNPSEQGEVR